MQETRITFETAKLAKEKGFYGFGASKVFDNGKLIKRPSMGMATWSDFGDRYTPAPTQSLLQKWLREVHHIWVEITVFGDGIGVMCAIKKATPDDREKDGSRIVRLLKMVEIPLHIRLEFDNEKALEYGLKEALELI